MTEMAPVARGVEIGTTEDHHPEIEIEVTGGVSTAQHSMG